MTTGKKQIHWFLKNVLVLKPEVVENTDAEDTDAEEPTTELMNKLEGGAQMRTEDTVSGSGANEIHIVRRSYKDIVMNGSELSRWAHSIRFT